MNSKIAEYLEEQIIDNVGETRPYIDPDNIAVMADEIVKLFAIPGVSGSYSYEIDFGAHCRAGIDITNNEPKVIGAMNGLGDGISLADIKIKKL